MGSATTITGKFRTAREGSFVYLPFQVPAGTTAVRVRYCHDQPELLPPNPLPNAPKHVLDLGIYDARPDAGAVWGRASSAAGAARARATRPLR